MEALPCTWIPAHSQGSVLPQQGEVRHSQWNMDREQEDVCDSQGNSFFPFSSSSSQGSILCWDREKEQEDDLDFQRNKDREQEDVSKGNSFSLFLLFIPRFHPVLGQGEGGGSQFPREWLFPFSFSLSHGSILAWNRGQEDVPDSQGNSPSLSPSRCPCPHL